MDEDDPKTPRTGTQDRNRKDRTMSTMSGNPFVGEPDGNGVVDAVVFSADGSPMQTTEFLLDRINRSVLALAFEVRTANLQAVQKMTLDMLLNPNFDVANETEAAAEIDSLNDQINSRLGLEN